MLVHSYCYMAVLCTEVHMDMLTCTYAAAHTCGEEVFTSVLVRLDKREEEQMNGGDDQRVKELHGRACTLEGGAE